MHANAQSNNNAIIAEQKPGLSEDVQSMLRSMVNDMRQCQQPYLGEHSKEFEALCDAETIKLLHEERDNHADAVSEVLMALVKEFVTLTKAINQTDSSLLSFAGSEILIEAVKLARIVLHSKDTWFARSEIHYLHRKEKIQSIKNAIKAATSVIQDHDKHDAVARLITTIKCMRHEIEGPWIFRNENRFYCRFLGVLATLAGIGLFIAGLSLGPVALVAGVLLSSLGVGFSACGFFPDAFDSDARKIEVQCSRDTAQTMYRHVEHFFSQKPQATDNVFAEKKSDCAEHVYDAPQCKR